MGIERTVVEALSAADLTIAVAESCTGGLIASRLTSVPGASRALLSAVVPYANEAKTSMLGVPADMIAAHGAVSAEAAEAMAEGVRSASGADVGLAVTCVAGPGGGSAAKPVGTAFTAIADIGGTEVRRLHLAGSRAWIREQLSEDALGAVLDRLGTVRPPLVGASLVVVADEVLQGLTADTNSGEIARALFLAGMPLRRVDTVPDDVEAISSAMVEAAREARLVLVCGGLGPTPDDRTVEAAAMFLGRPLAVDPAALWMVERRLVEGHAAGIVPNPTMTDARRKMATLPAGAAVLENDVGYGPGCVAETAGRTVVLLPGVPAEMRHLLGRHVMPLVEGMTAGSIPANHVEEVVYVGSESSIAPLMASLSLEFPDVSIGSYPDLERYRTTIRVVGPEAPVRDAASRLRGTLLDAERAGREP
ncbi:MAG: nicotinamide-nucleotide amidohydrolase family protein [Thermoplasmata archaeon]|nr:nicotinamide-nucleotide amidohydrolase family protein [Thermoplasmata archaeon]